MEEPRAKIESDLRIQLPNNALFTGASQSGKTTLVLRLLQNSSCVFTPPPKRVLFYYDLYQDVYGEVKEALQKQGIDMLLFKGISSVNLDNIDSVHGETILLIDDFSESTSSSSEIARLCTNGRHKNISVWLIWHQLFSKHAASRTIAQNVRYYFFLPSLRLESQLGILGSQLGMKKELVSVFKACIQSPHEGFAYLLLDLGPATNPLLRLRSSIENPHHQYCFF